MKFWGFLFSDKAIWSKRELPNKGPSSPVPGGPPGASPIAPEENIETLCKATAERHRCNPLLDVAPGAQRPG